MTRQLYILFCFVLLVLSTGCPTQDTQLGSRDAADESYQDVNNASAPTDAPQGRVVKSGKMRAEDPQVDALLLQQVVQITNETAISTIAMNDTQASFAASPLGVTQSLGIAYAGAKGTTRATLSSHFIETGDSFTLHAAINRLVLDVQDTETATVSMAHAIWVPASISLLPTYLDTLAVHYGLSVNLLNSQGESIDAANQWFQDQDMELDQDPVERESNVDGFLLTPTVKINAAWGVQFDPDRTTMLPFEGIEETENLPFMSYSGTVRGQVTQTYQAVELPMKDSHLKTVLISPPREQWSTWQAALTFSQIQEIRANLTDLVGVELMVPKLNTSSSVEHKPHLSSLGLASIFSRDANYAGMDGQGKLHLGNIVQHTRVSWDERGIDAQDDTLIVSTPAPINGNAIGLSFDRPFLYLMIDTRHDIIVLAGTFTQKQSTITSRL